MRFHLVVTGESVGPDHGQPADESGAVPMMSQPMEVSEIAEAVELALDELPLDSLGSMLSFVEADEYVPFPRDQAVVDLDAISFQGGEITGKDGRPGGDMDGVQVFAITLTQRGGDEDPLCIAITEPIAAALHTAVGQFLKEQGSKSSPNDEEEQA